MQIRILFLLMIVHLSAIAQQQKISLNPEQLTGDVHKTSFEKKEGRDILTVNRGTVWAKDIEFTDGILEVDVSVSPKKSLTGISFRGDADATCENIYLRVPLSGREDAIQYAPFFHNEDYWQLYPEHQAKYTYPETGWVHMKIVVRGNTAALYIDTATRPSLTVDHLRTGNRSGRIGLWCLSEQSFSNFSFTPLPAMPFTSITERKEEGLVTSYRLSEAFTIDKKTKQLAYPAAEKLKWQTVSTEEDGLLNIGKYRFKQSSGTFEQNSNDMVWLKLDLTEKENRIRKIYFDFSNRVMVFLNGKPLYYGDHSYRLKDSFYKGTIDKKFIADAVFLPLEKGRNELLIGISSVANGWGIISKIE